jgi:hypothetical protein
MARIQIITILVSLSFLFYIARLIIKGKLREEYSIVWLVCTFILIIFSFWREGLDVMSALFGVFVPANLVFTACIFAVLVYLLHLSVVSSKLQRENKQLAQKIALMNEQINSSDKNTDTQKTE